jgi:hypothetical protein
VTLGRLVVLGIRRWCEFFLAVTEVKEPRTIDELIAQARPKPRYEPNEEEQPDRTELEIEDLMYSRTGRPTMTDDERVWHDSHGTFEKMAKRALGGVKKL